MKTTTAPYLRGWYAQQRAEMLEDRERRHRTRFGVWLVVVLAALAAIGMEANHRERTAEYRALPSADEVILQQSAADHDAMLTAIVEREWAKIEGSRK